MQKISQSLPLIWRSWSVRSTFQVIILILTLWFIYFIGSTILLPYPIEYREGASQVLTQLLLDGENPFSASNQPLAMNNYGVLYSLVVYPFAMIFGNTLAVYRAINFFFLVLIFLAVFRTACKNGSDRAVTLSFALMIVIVLSSWAGLGAYPSAMGTFLFLSAILIPVSFSFDLKSLWVSAFLAVLAYYIKPYFVLSFGIVLAYVFLFISKRKGLLYGLFFSSIFIIFYSFVRLTFEFYFIDTFWGNVANASRQYAHMTKQLIELTREFALIFILVLWVIIRNAGEARTSFFDKPFVDVWDFDRPVFSRSVNFFVFWIIISILTFIFVLGVHDGAYMTYAYQIILPPLLIWLAMNINFKIYKDKFVLPLILLNVITLTFMFLNVEFLSQSRSSEWIELYDYAYDAKNILNSPLIVSALIERNMLPVDSGQTEYYYFIVEPYPRTGLLGPDYSVFQRRGEEYKELIFQSIREKRYDRLMLTESQWIRNIFASEIEKNYILVDKITVTMPQVDQDWTVEIWEPIK